MNYCWSRYPYNIILFNISDEQGEDENFQLLVQLDIRPSDKDHSKNDVDGPVQKMICPVSLNQLIMSKFYRRHLSQLLLRVHHLGHAQDVN